MQIDVISDTVCPWCFIGKRRLERAMAVRPQIPFTVNWRPFRLDPGIPRGGVDRKAYMKAKFGEGADLSAMADALRVAAETENIHIDLDRIVTRPDSVDSHRLIRWALSDGLQSEVAELLFRAYFSEGRDIGDPRVLADIGEYCGLDRAVVTELLAGDADRDLVEQEDAMAHRMGITGVPTFIFANKYMISGAHPAEQIVQIIDKVQADL